MSKRLLLTLAITSLLTAGCAGSEGGGDDRLGPLDGAELTPVDLERVAVGDVAPDFRLAALEGEPVRLSDYRGSRNVVLVFYRGHW